MSLDATAAALEWALRVVLCAALAIHSILDTSDPITGAKSYVLQVEDSIPRWLLPAIGILRAVAAVAIVSSNPDLVLAALAYVSTLWCGAVYFHVRRRHHPAVVLPAMLFVVLAIVVTAIRVNIWSALVGTAACAVAAVGLGLILVTPAQDRKQSFLWPQTRPCLVEQDTLPLQSTASLTLQVRNRTSKPLAVSCGALPVTVPAGSSREVNALQPTAQISEADFKPLCALGGLPTESLPGSHATIVLQEVGGVVCAALDYSQAPRRREVVAPSAASVDNLP